MPKCLQYPKDTWSAARWMCATAVLVAVLLLLHLSPSHILLLPLRHRVAGLAVVSMACRPIRRSTHACIIFHVNSLVFVFLFPPIFCAMFFQPCYVPMRFPIVLFAFAWRCTLSSACCFCFRWIFWFTKEKKRYFRSKIYNIELFLESGLLMSQTDIDRLVVFVVVSSLPGSLPCSRSHPEWRLPAASSQLTIWLWSRLMDSQLLHFPSFLFSRRILCWPKPRCWH